jgi:hypothetical protein
MELTRIYFHYFLEKVSIKRCSRELHLTQKTVGKLYAKIRSAISSYVIEDLKADTLLGELPQYGENMDEQDQYPVVEIDESLFSHFTEQGVRTQVWVWVCMIEDRITAVCLFYRTELARHLLT